MEIHWTSVLLVWSFLFLDEQHVSLVQVVHVDQAWPWLFNRKPWNTSLGLLCCFWIGNSVLRNGPGTYDGVPGRLHLSLQKAQTTTAKETRSRISSSAEKQVWRARRRWGRHLRWWDREEGGEQERLIPEWCPAAPRAQCCSSGEILAVFASGLVFESASQREIHVKSFSLKRRMTPGLVMLLHFLNLEEIIIKKKQTNNNNKEASKGSKVSQRKTCCCKWLELLLSVCREAPRNDCCGFWNVP